MRYKSQTIISVLGGLIDECKGEVHPGPINDAAICSDKRCLFEKHGYVSWEMLSETHRLSAETGRYKCSHPVSNDDHPSTGKYFRACRPTGSKVVYPLISSYQILVEVIVSPDIGLARRTLELWQGFQSRFGLAGSAK
jgi:hypothetical protein